LKVVVDILVLGTCDRTVGGVTDVAKILHKTRVDAQNGVLVVLGLHNVADRQRSDVTAVLEIARVERLQAHFVENLAALGPLRKSPGGSAVWGAGNVFVLVVLLGPTNDAVLNGLLYDLSNFGLGTRPVHDETH